MFIGAAAAAVNPVQRQTSVDIQADHVDDTAEQPTGIVVHVEAQSLGTICHRLSYRISPLVACVRAECCKTNVSELVKEFVPEKYITVVDRFDVFTWPVSSVVAPHR